MYSLYKENRENCVSMTIYARKFHELGLAFKKPQKDTCHTCDTMKIKIAYANEDEKAILITAQNKHHPEAKEAYQSKANDKKTAKQDPSVPYLVLICSNAYQLLT